MKTVISSICTIAGLIGLSVLSVNVNGFMQSSVSFSRSILQKTHSSSLHLAKSPSGFGGDSKPKKREVSAGQVDRDQKAAKYDDISSQGGQEYRVFVRQFGSDDESWLPTGSVAVPRGSQVSDAIFANETGLKDAIVRSYPKLKGFESEFEYGFNLKVYPDDPIEIAMKGGGKSSGMSVGNWISNLLSPVDASAVSGPPPPKTTE